MLKHAGITHIVNCMAHKLPSAFQDQLTYLPLRLEDSTDSDLEPSIIKALQFLKKVQKQSGKVLIHCRKVS